MNDLTHDVSTAAATALAEAVTFDDDAAAEHFFGFAYAVVTAAITAFQTETEKPDEPDSGDA